MQFRDYFQQSILATLIIFTLNIIFTLPTLINLPDVSQFALCYLPVAYYWQIYRLLTSQFCHGGLVHLAMNMLSLSFLGYRLESKFKTLPFLCLTIIMLFLISITYVLIMFFMVEVWPESFGGGSQQWSYHCSVGFSGVLFGYLFLILCYHPNPTIQVTQNCKLPKWILVFVFLLFCHFYSSNVSDLGHFLGIFAGFCYHKQLLGFLLPNVSWLKSMEEWSIMQRIINLNQYGKVDQSQNCIKGFQCLCSKKESQIQQFEFTTASHPRNLVQMGQIGISEI